MGREHLVGAGGCHRGSHVYFRGLHDSDRFHGRQHACRGLPLREQNQLRSEGAANASFGATHSQRAAGFHGAELHQWFALPYKRLPGIREVERYDAVVFNFPHGDTIVVDPQWAGHDYYAILRMEAIKRAGGNVGTYVNDPAPYEAQARAALEKRFGIRARPLDKTENYVKRCVALPGETISAEDGQLFINEKH